MTDMQSFASWFLQELPDFLMSPPISLIMGLIILILVIDCIKGIRNI